ncbi:MAG: sensor histidine kinase [Desulfobulbales bacterium]
MKISTKIFSTVFFSSLSLLVLASIIFYTSEKKSLQQQIYNQLESIASHQQARLESIIEQNLERLKLVSSRTQLRISLEKYSKGENTSANLTKMTRILNDAKSSISSFRDIYILSLKGKVVASTKKMNFQNNIQINSSFLERSQTKNSADTLFLDKNENLRLLLGGPLFLNDNLLGIIVIESDAENIVDSVGNYFGLGSTGEIIVARETENGDALFLFPTRFDPKASLKRTISKNDSQCPLIVGLSQHKDITATGIDYRQKAILEVSKYLKLVDWTILVKIDEEEAFSSITRAKNLVATVTVSLILLSILIALTLSRNITKPIVYLTGITKKISNDGLLTRIEKNSNDEIGELANSFNEMIKTRQEVEEEREKIVVELQKALSEVKVLRGILPICSSCKKIRDEKGYWKQIESYIRDHSDAEFSHGICDECYKKLYKNKN